MTQSFKNNKKRDSNMHDMNQNSMGIDIECIIEKMKIMVSIFIENLFSIISGMISIFIRFITGFIMNESCETINLCLPFGFNGMKINVNELVVYFPLMFEIIYMLLCDGIVSYWITINFMITLLYSFFVMNNRTCECTYQKCIKNIGFALVSSGGMILLFTSDIYVMTYLMMMYLINRTMMNFNVYIERKDMKRMMKTIRSLSSL
jgi:hypothetical protein